MKSASTLKTTVANNHKQRKCRRCGQPVGKNYFYCNVCLTGVSKETNWDNDPGIGGAASVQRTGVPNAFN